MTKKGIYLGILAMAIIVTVSNILVQYVLGDWLTWGALTYPFAFLVTDIINRLYGAKQARKVVFAGFITGIICSFIGTQIVNEYGPLVTLRIVIGSGTAFLVAQLLDIAIFDQLRKAVWWRAPLVSSVIGSLLDTFLFFTIAFSSIFIFLEPNNNVSWAGEMMPVLNIGVQAPFWVSLAVADWLVKLSLAMIALIPFRILVARFNTQPT